MVFVTPRLKTNTFTSRIMTKEINGLTEKTTRSKRHWSSFLLPILIGLSLIAVVVFASIHFRLEKEYKTGNDLYKNLRADQVSLLHIKKDMGQAAPQEEQTSTNSGSMDFTYLEIVNPDVVAWITAAGLPIDLPIVQGQDNDYYLTRLFDHQPNRLGTLFVDVYNKPDFSDKNTVIYGHNMNDGSMFASIANYRTQEFYESFPVMDLYTPTADYKIELFAGYVANANEPFIQFVFQDDADFLNYIDWLKLISTFESQVTIGPEDRIVTLSTCTYDFDNARYVVFGKLVPVN